MNSALNTNLIECLRQIEQHLKNADALARCARADGSTEAATVELLMKVAVRSSALVKMVKEYQAYLAVAEPENPLF